MCKAQGMGRGNSFLRAPDTKQVKLGEQSCAVSAGRERETERERDVYLKVAETFSNLGTLRPLPFHCQPPVTKIHVHYHSVFHLFCLFGGRASSKTGRHYEEVH